MSEHTPGPWHVGNGLPMIYSETGAGIGEAWIEVGNRSRDESWANGYLMAAAPRLLRACEMALAIHRRYCDRVGAADEWAREVQAALEVAVDEARGDAGEVSLS